MREFWPQSRLSRRSRFVSGRMFESRKRADRWRRSLCMPTNFMPSGEDYLRFLPEIIMTAIGTLIMLLQPLLGEKNKSIYGHLTLITLLASVWAAAVANTVPGTAFSNMLIVDGYGTFFRILVLTVGILTVLCSYQYLRREEAEAAE